MSTPLVAGAAVLVRSFYTDLEGVAPSAALIKATLLNGAFDMRPGQYGTGATQEIPDPARPNHVAGWGRIDIENSIFPAAPGSFRYEDEAVGLATNESVAYAFTVNAASQPLKAILVWSDYPGSPVAAGGLVNDLDLSISDPAGTVHYPNNAGDVSQNLTTFYDRINNVVGIDIRNPVAGDYVLHVEGYNIPLGPQSYALLVRTGNLSVLTRQYPPISPADVITRAISSSRIEIVWADRSDDESGFKIERKAGSGGAWAGIATAGPNAGLYVAAGQADETRYYFRVKAFNAQGSSSFFNETNVLTLAAPSGLLAAAASPARISLDWSDNSSYESGYEIWRRVSGNPDYRLAGTVAADITRYVDANLSASTAYEFRVRAISTNSESDFSASASATTLKSSGGGAGGLCFIAVCGGDSTAIKKIIRTLLAIVIICTAGLIRSYKNQISKV
jgi:hypothetical protein